LQELLFPDSQLLLALRKNPFAGQQLTDHQDPRS
jgi:hypothetical protein